MKQRLFLIIYLLFFSYKAYTLETEEVSLWKEDIQQLQKLIEIHHIDPFVNIDKYEFYEQIHNLLKSLPDMNEAEVEVGIMRLMRSIGDGHTFYNMMSGPHRHYPFRFKYFVDKLKVVDSIAKYSFLQGAELTAVNGYSIPKLEQQLAPFVNYVDNPYSFRFSFSLHITLAKFLYGTGISDGQDEVTYQFLKDGRSISMKVHSVPMEKFGGLNTQYPVLVPDINYFNIDLSGIRLALLGKYDAVYVDFDSYPDFSDLQEQCENIVDIIRGSRVQNLVIDFRDNHGGDFYVGLALSSCIQNLDQFDWRNGIYVMIDEGTQSAAMSNAAQYQQILNANLVGTPTGADPNIASETNRFKLKNSKREISIAKRYYRFIQSPTDALYPDFPMTTSWRDYKQGRDGALLQLLNHIQEKDRENQVKS
ncbi:S41 family peptidase [Microbulbifer variabilis]|uniref:S41 family peptidase n=1 Tax=Microbulbifer variabilis TaxID=266805 RepID=A0ABY4VCS9_9GAMM|nr:S41 family peptidase [Microbulbifer variabilis]USD21942.1 S41 family peptidase [Microbulbifer variabilis]